MPTGYTAFIEDGKVRDAKSFLHLCLRAFGVCIKMGDTLELKDDYTQDIIDGYQKEIDYHLEQLDGDRKRLCEIRKLTDEEKCERYIKETKEKIKDLKYLRDKDITKYADYMKIKEEVEGWDCSGKFQDVKEFALEEINMCASTSSYYDEQLKACGKPTRAGYEKVKDEYMESLISNILWDIDYHTKCIDRAVKGRKEALKFYNEFKEELNKLDKK